MARRESLRGRPRRATHVDRYSVQRLEGVSLSDAVDKQLAAAADQERWRRLHQVFTDLARVARLRQEGMSMDDIAIRLGWTRLTLHRWLKAAEVMQRKGIRMTKS